MIKVGDFVTWRTRPNALALTGCKVLGLGADDQGRPAAMLDVGRFALDGQPAGALLEHLTLEPITEVTK